MLKNVVKLAPHIVTSKESKLVCNPSFGTNKTFQTFRRGTSAKEASMDDALRPSFISYLVANFSWDLKERSGDRIQIDSHLLSFLRKGQITVKLSFTRLGSGSLENSMIFLWFWKRSNISSNWRETCTVFIECKQTFTTFSAFRYILVFFWNISTVFKNHLKCLISQLRLFLRFSYTVH